MEWRIERGGWMGQSKKYTVRQHIGLVFWSVIWGIPIALVHGFELFCFWNHLIIYASTYDFVLVRNCSVDYVQFTTKKDSMTWSGRRWGGNKGYEWGDRVCVAWNGEGRQEKVDQGAGRRAEKVYAMLEFPCRAHSEQKTALKCVSTWWIRFHIIFVKCALRLAANIKH